MYLNNAESVYSESVVDQDIDESTSSDKSSIWNFGGKRSKNSSSGNSSVKQGGSHLKRTTQQIMATARAVANDMSHPNQEEVHCVQIYICIYSIAGTCAHICISGVCVAKKP